MHTGELDYAVWCTLQSQTTLKISVFMFSNLLRLLTTFLSQNFWSKIDFSICDLQTHRNILRHHREKTIVKFWINTEPCQVTDFAEGCIPVESDSAVGCTLQSFFRYFVFMNSRCDAYCGVWLHCMMHTAKFFKNSKISAKSKLHLKIF